MHLISQLGEVGAPPAKCGIEKERSIVNLRSINGQITLFTDMMNSVSALIESVNEVR